MPRTTFASDVVDFIEGMAQEQLRYTTISSEQAEVLRMDLPKFDAAMTQIQQTPFVGQLLQPTQDNADEYLAYCNNICLMIPQDFDELSLLSNKFWRLIRASRVKNFHAAYAALMCLITCKFSRQSDKVQRAIMKRVNELDIS
jgi:hypothetical protein